MPPSPTLYTIAVPDASLTPLHDKLQATILCDELENTTAEDAWERGTPLSEIQRLTRYWRTGFDWRKQEARLNELPNYMQRIEIDGFDPLDVHFIWQKSEVVEAIPLLFVHGWPGSFIEVTKLLPLLKGGNGRPAFHVVAPSLPNFGFSSGVRKKGYALPQYAETCHKLMLSLGYDKYVTQGVHNPLPLPPPLHLLPRHPHQPDPRLPTQFHHPPPPLPAPPPNPLHHLQRAGLAREAWFDSAGQGYRILQGTKPQTLGYALSDSPTALLAWLLEKLHDWVEGTAPAWTDDDVLTWVSIYWFSTAGPAASLRIYYEGTHGGSERTSKAGMARWIGRGVKIGLSYFPRDLCSPPGTWGRTLGRVCFEAEHERGGHFAAWEQPEALAGDLARMFGRGGPCEGVVPGKGGYAVARVAKL